MITISEKTNSQTMTMVTDAKEVTISMYGTEGTLFTIDWGDGIKNEEYMKESESLNKYTHTYSDTSAHTITIIGENITRLTCKNNQLTSLDVSKNAVLEKLICWGNKLTELDVSNNTALVKLDCSLNQLTSLDVSKNTALEDLSYDENRINIVPTMIMTTNAKEVKIIMSGEEGNTATIDWGDGTIKEVNFHRSRYRYMNMNDENRVYSTHIYSDSDSHIITITGKNIIKLECAGNELTSLNVSRNIALTTLYCYNNQLTSLDVSKNITLTSLGCRYTQLVCLDVSKNTALTNLDVSNTQLTSLDISRNTALTSLCVLNTQLISLDISKNIALEVLNCSNTQLACLDVSKNIALTSLDVSNTQLISLDISKNTALEVLNCSNNQLTSLDVSKNILLKELECENNQLTKLDLSKENTVLSIVKCRHNKLSAATLNALFDTLHSNTIERCKLWGGATKIVRVGFNPGEPTCNRSIAKEKGWN